MFNKKSNNAVNAATPTSSNINTLVEGSHSEGTINTQNDLRVDGTIVGTVNCGGKLIIGPTGNVDGEVTSQNAVIEGRFNGCLLYTSPSPRDRG